MRPAAVVRVLAGARRQARCRECRRPIEWGVTPPHGRQVPLNPGVIVLRTEENPETGVRFDVLPGDAVHFVTCGKAADVSRVNG